MRLAVLGSTGSIGLQALDVAARFPDRIEVVALAANRSGALLAEQARAFGVRQVAVADPAYAPGSEDLPDGAVCMTGPDAVARIAQEAGADVVLNGLVGAAGLRASESALRSGARLALANKESLVVGGDLLMPLAGGHARPRTDPSLDRLLPVDSEHSAIFQCLVGESRADIARIWLTASGGPFRGWDEGALAHVTRDEALAHPRWTMGPKITVDSATLMNKGLEAIEAHHLFAVEYDAIAVVVHPQSAIHSMVEFADGSVKAHLGATDMRVPIQYALSHPDRWRAPVAPVDMIALERLDLGAPDSATFRCLALALEAGRAGGTMPAAMNAANEVAVAAFLAGTAAFTDIPQVVEDVMNAHDVARVVSLDQLEQVDRDAREKATAILASARR